MNRKYFVGFYISFLILLYSGCMKKPNAPSEYVGFDLDLEFHDRSPHSENPGAKTVPNLFKTNKIIEDQVLMLPFESGFGDTAYDRSIYENNALLVNVQWITFGTNKAIVISESNSYGRVNSNPVLNGTHGIKIAAKIYMFNSVLRQDRIVIDKHDVTGGYTLGVLQDGRPFFRIIQNLQTTEVISDSILEINKWYTIRAGFTPNPAVLSVYEKTDTTGVTGLLPVTYNPLLIGAENNLAGSHINNFNGLIDSVSIKTTVDYEDFDFIRVAVIDGNQLINRDSLRAIDPANIGEFFYRFDFWRHYRTDLDSVLYRPTAAAPPTWAGLRGVWDEYFKVLSEQNLVLKGGYAEGTLNGIVGLNLLTVAALRNGYVIYYGEGFVLGVKDINTKAHIDLYSPEY